MVVVGELLTQLTLTPLLILVLAVLVLVLVDFGVVALLWVVFPMLELVPKHLIWSIGLSHFVVLAEYIMKNIW